VHSEWRELATRLAADASLVDGMLSLHGTPDQAEAVELAEAVAVLTVRLRQLSTTVGRTYGGRLPDAVLTGYRQAVTRLGEAEQGLAQVGAALRRTIRPQASAPANSDDAEGY
jgi:Flp pilus assembly protein CpaB